eukprot:SAG22_NODE_1382_length_4544_cov_1.860742_3_plen_92_part_00
MPELESHTAVFSRPILTTSSATVTMATLPASAAMMKGECREKQIQREDDQGDHDPLRLASAQLFNSRTCPGHSTHTRSETGLDSGADQQDS